MLLIADPFDVLEPYAAVLENEGHHVDRAQSGIEANDLILTGLAVASPYELIILHHSQNKEDTRQLIGYWRNQDPFLPLILISLPQTVTDDELRSLGLLDCIPEDVPVEQAKSRLDLIQQTIALGATFRLRADILERPATMTDPLQAVDRALDLILQRLTVRAVAFVSYTAVVNEPIVQITNNLEIFDQNWLDDVCEQPWHSIEPILEANRMVFECTESPRYLFPISSTRGWEGLLVFFAPDTGRTTMDPILAGQYTTIAEGLKFMLEHVRTRESLAHARQSKSEYMSILSERIRQPMSGLQDTCDLLLMIESEDRVRDMANKINHNAKMAANMLKDVIELGRIDDGMLVIHPQPISLQTFLEELVNDLELLFAEKNLRVLFERSQDADFSVNGDPNKLTRVFSNLLTNAVRFSPQDASITIAFEVGIDDWIRVSVTDQGPGLAPGQAETIFERPQNTHSSSITEQGIGLYLCRKFITAHDGRIWVESDPGFGCTFMVQLPPLQPQWTGLDPDLTM